MFRDIPKSLMPLVLGALLMMSLGLQGAVAMYHTEAFNDSYRQVPEDMEIQGNPWLIEVVDSDSMANGFRIAVDSNDVPHIAYSDYDSASGLYVLRYANRTGGTWKAEKLDFLGGDFVKHVAIALDKTNRPHIAYNGDYKCPPECVKYTNWTGHEWKTTTLDSDLGSSSTISIALNSKGYPHIIYAGYYAMHAYWSGDGWEFEELAFAGLPNSIALDNKDFPHISYVGHGGLEHAKWNGTDWVIQVVTNRSVDHVSSDLDADNNPHIVFTANPDYDVNYAKWNGSAWEIETVESEGKYYAYVVVDRFNRPHIICKRGDVYPNAIKYAVRNGGSWQIETVDFVGHMSNDLPIAVDANGNPHLSYHDITERNLRYATKQIEAPSKDITLDIDPNTLNLKSRGRWIVAYLTTDGANADEIDASSLLLNDVLSPERWEVQNNTTLMAKFNRAAVQAILPISDTVDIKITGQWMDGETFELHDIIRVILPGRVPLAPKGTLSGVEFRTYLQVASNEVRYFQLDALYSVTYQERSMNQQPQRTSLGKGLI